MTSQCTFKNDFQVVILRENSHIALKLCASAVVPSNKWCRDYIESAIIETFVPKTRMCYK